MVDEMSAETKRPVQAERTSSNAKPAARGSTMLDDAAIRAMDDRELVVLCANARRLTTHGSATQMVAATAVLPTVEAEISEREAAKVRRRSEELAEKRAAKVKLAAAGGIGMTRGEGGGEPAGTT